MKLLFILLALSGLVRVSPSEVGISGECVSAIDSIAERAVADTVFPGAVIAIVRNDKLAFLKSYGAVAVYPEYEPVNDSVIYDMASLSKSFSTAVAALQLVDDGLLSLDAPVSRYLPGFRPYDSTVRVKGRRKRITEEITVRQLMLHTSGFLSYASYKKIREEYSGDMKAYLCCGAPRKNRPGTRYRYSCLNYITLQLIIEKLRGERLCDYAASHIFAPLGLRNTCYFPGGAPDSLLSRIAPVEMLPDSVLVPRGMVHDPLAREIGNGNSGNAGLYSTASDVAVLCAAIMNGGCLYVQDNGYLGAEKTDSCCRILSEQSAGRMFAVDSRSRRTLGWDSRSKAAEFGGTFYGRPHTICHTGYTGPSVFIDADSGTAVIIMCNRVHPFDRGHLTYEHALLKDVRTAISDAVAASVL